MLQLTSMVDMFTIMIVFLLKSYSTSAVQVNPHEKLQLPSSTSYKDPVEALRLVVALDGIYVDDNRIVELKDGQVADADTDAGDKNFIRPLYEALDKQAEKSRGIANKNEDLEFEGSIVMQADKRLNYATLKKVMYTSSIAGYADLKLATMGN
ncbi:MAG: biopolymer transporter ExbD [Bdellovibrionales bacterium]|nr:biopolymer transporter ExbD [Bdellovibrionales bacterium]